MEFWQILPNKRYKSVIIALFVLISVYFLLQFFLFKSDPIFALKTYLGKSYLYTIEQFANLLLNLTGSPAHYDNFLILSGKTIVNGFYPDIRYERLTLLLIVLIWLIKAPYTEKLLFTLSFFIALFLLNSTCNALGAHMAALQYQTDSIIAISITFWLMIIFTLFFLWFRRHKRVILSSISRYKINVDLFENDLYILLLTYVLIVTISLLTEIFEYRIWINFLFLSAQKILALLGYEAIVDNSTLVGSNGTIFMLKACLGFQMMLLFVVMVILTGKSNNSSRWIFIITGLFLLNIINIFRFVFLFIHLQKHGNYMLSIEVHNLYNYLTYAIVFLMWIFWFEKFADIKTKTIKADQINNSGEIDNLNQTD